MIVTPCPDYSETACACAISQIVSRVPALQHLQQGTKIVIKANLVTMLRPDKAATTHPALIAALTAYLKSKGAVVTVGDGPGGTFTKGYLDGVYNASGMRETGAGLNENFAVKKAQYPEAAVLRDFEYTAYLDDADLIINFCKLKSHGMMGLSCAVKNMFGAIPGLTKPTYHYRFPEYSQFADMLIDLNEYFRPAVHIADAVIAMEGNGPTMGTPRQVGAVLASESPYALDLVAAKLIGLSAEQVPTLHQAHLRGLAPESADNVPVIGALEPLLVPDFNTVSAQRGLDNFLGISGPASTVLNKLLRDILAVKPRLVPASCIGCGKCAGLCPADAIRLRRKKPEIDRKKCIRCFCCQEFCPAGAMKARRSAFGDFLLKHTQK